MKRILTVLFSLVFISLSLIAKEETIVVTNQKEFDGIASKVNSIISSVVSKGSTELCTINVQIKAGLYKFSENQIIKTSKSDRKNISLSIRGVDLLPSVIISDGDVFTPSKAVKKTDTHYVCNIADYQYQYGFVDGNFNFVGLATTGDFTENGVNLAKSKPVVVDKAKHLMKIELPDELAYLKNKKSAYFKGSVLYLTTQWSDTFLKDLYSDSKYIYGTYQSNNAIAADYFDETYKVPSRFYLVNVPDMKIAEDKVAVINGQIYIPNSIRQLYVTKYTRAFTFNNLNFNNVDVSGLTFVGNSFVEDSQLLRFFNSSNVTVSACTFKNILSDVFMIKGDNKGYNNGNQSYVSSNGRVVNCRFRDNGRALGTFAGIDGARFIGNYSYNSGCIQKKAALECSTKNYYIANNEMVNFPGNAFYLSTTRTATTVVSGVVEYNEIYNEPEYSSVKNCLIDVGMIYCGAHNDNTVIRHNVLHDFYAYANGRGMFFDSGAYNITVEGNLLFNIGPSYLVDSRYVSSVDNQILPTNTNTFLRNNVIMGHYRWEGNPKNASQAHVGWNFANASLTGKKHATSNADVTEGVENTTAVIKDGKVYLDKASYKKISKNKAISSYIKSRIKKAK